MDVRFIRQENGSLARAVYQKPTHTNRYVHFESHHPPSVKSRIVLGLADRAIRVCSSSEDRDRELKKDCLGNAGEWLSKKVHRESDQQTDEAHTETTGG